MSKTILFNTLKTAINAVGSFRCFGLYNDQFAREGVEDVVTYPAVFIQFEGMDWEPRLSTVKNLQEAPIEINLHIGFKRLDKDNESVLAEVDQLFVALEGFTNDEFDPLRRIRETPDTSYDNVEVWILTFKTRLRDTQATMVGTITHTITALEARDNSSLKIDNDVIRTGTTEGLADDD
jgi:hypothetical protein